MERILLIEDDVHLSDKLKEQLEKWQLEVITDVNFSDCVSDVLKWKPKLIIMDIGLPTFDGFYWCSKIREVSQIPILFLSSRDSDYDKVMGMNMGGDDYMTKPFSMDVLTAKINAMLRRTYDYKAAEADELYFSEMVLSSSKSQVIYEGNYVELTKNELRILVEMIKHKGEIVSRSKLMHALWDDDQFVNENTLTVNINRLRKKLKELKGVDYIKTKKGLGYMLDETVSY